MENLFDELGFEEFKEKVLPHVGGFENTFSVSESHFYDEVYRELEEDGIEEPTDEQIEKRQQEIIDNYGSAEEFFIEFGDEYVKQMIDHGDAYMNFETMAENVISEYGAGHELSSYDNSTEEVEYNGKTYYIFRQARRNNKMNKKANKEKILAIDIDDQEFLQGLARKYPLATVREIQRALFNLKKTNITETIMSEVADYFKNNGFEVKEKGIGFEIKANKNVKKATNKLVSIINKEINKSASKSDWEFPGYETETVESKIEWLYTHNVNYNREQEDNIYKLRSFLKNKQELTKDDIEEILYELKHNNKNYRGDQYWIIDDLKVEDFIKNLK